LIGIKFSKEFETILKTEKEKEKEIRKRKKGRE
jgi:hypothetical protein